MKKNIFSYLIIALIAGGSFVAGMMANYTLDLDIVKKSQKAVEDFLTFPETAEYKNVHYYEIRQTLDHGILGYVCGEVLVFKSENSFGYKRFLVKTYMHQDGRNVVSIPLIERSGNIFPNDNFNIIWDQFCREQSDKKE
ncbi:hypothetical protein I5E78_19990 [Providencia stuartii]|uniref:hypothetical protein n=1 Tax=Providencia stuartii TaxID=588 RepID=UPI0018C640ED|nr:hypothetical protein [Providencia stuartii]MBG5937381.1 hypothetical protein [Providencia stuartii]